MSDQTITKVSGSGKVVNPTSGTLESAPAAQTEEVSLGQQQTSWRKSGPYWAITEYTTEEINAIREADKLDPDLAEHYKDLLED